MDDAAIRDYVLTHLQQAHAMERAQVGELRTLGDVAQIPAVRVLLVDHAATTQGHGDLLEQRITELGGSASLRLLVQTIGAAMPKQVIDRIRPASECAILRDAISAEAMEVAAYLLLEAEAVRGGDESTALLAEELRADDAAMRDELMSYWNQAVDRDIDRRATSDTISTGQAAHAMLLDHLRDIHALERNAVVMLTTVLATVQDEVANLRVEDHRNATTRHVDTIANRLNELGSRPSLRKQAQGLAFAAVKAPINLVRSERAAKDLRDMYVVEHLELVAYSQLAVLADRAGDERTAQLAQVHIAEETAMADWLEREGGRFLLETMYARS